MSWGTSYTHTGYLSRISKREIDSKMDECRAENDSLWREILAYMAATPPQTARDCEGEEYPYQEFLAFKVNELRQGIAENDTLLARLEDCADTLADHPENVTEG